MDQRWFYHPEVQARVAEAEADFRESRFTRTETPEEAQAFLDRLKRGGDCGAQPAAAPSG
ncbi:MAG TPA: hypothetical protein VJT67_15650 [Longimicrobiaceae bacterium]|nr:hypothetical protein [Longimicrobiaceae bacterium]